MCDFNVLSSSEEAVWVEQGEHWQSCDHEDAEGTNRKPDYWLVSAGAKTLCAFKKGDLIAEMEY